MPRRQAADHEKAAAVTANTTDALPTASRTPPRAGPANMPTLEIVLIETLAAVNSSGVRASEGSSACCAGWNAVVTTEVATANA